MTIVFYDGMKIIKPYMFEKREPAFQISLNDKVSKEEEL